MENKNENIPESLQTAYEVIIDDIKRTFVLGRYIPSAKSLDPTPIALMEDITLEVQEAYPKAELVYTSQLIDTPHY